MRPVGAGILIKSRPQVQLLALGLIYSAFTRHVCYLQRVMRVMLAFQDESGRIDGADVCGPVFSVYIFGESSTSEIESSPGQAAYVGILVGVHLPETVQSPCWKSADVARRVIQGSPVVVTVPKSILRKKLKYVRFYTYGIFGRPGLDVDASDYIEVMADVHEALMRDHGAGFLTHPVSAATIQAWTGETYEVSD